MSDTPQKQQATGAVSVGYQGGGGQISPPVTPVQSLFDTSSIPPLSPWLTPPGSPAPTYVQSASALTQRSQNSSTVFPFPPGSEQVSGELTMAGFYSQADSQFPAVNSDGDVPFYGASTPVTPSVMQTWVSDGPTYMAPQPGTESPPNDAASDRPSASYEMSGYPSFANPVTRGASSAESFAATIASNGSVTGNAAPFSQFTSSTTSYPEVPSSSSTGAGQNFSGGFSPDFAPAAPYSSSASSSFVPPEADAADFRDPSSAESSDVPMLSASSAPAPVVSTGNPSPAASGQQVGGDSVPVASSAGRASNSGTTQSVSGFIEGVQGRDLHLRLTDGSKVVIDDLTPETVAECQKVLNRAGSGSKDAAWVVVDLDASTGVRSFTFGLTPSRSAVPPAPTNAVAQQRQQAHSQQPSYGMGA